MGLSAEIRPVSLSDLEGESVFQTSFWAEAKSGSWKSYAFRYRTAEREGTLLVLVRRLFLNFSIAYSPFGFYEGITSEEFAFFSAEIRKYLPKGTFLLRLDFPWNTAELSGSRIKHCKESVQPEGTVRINLPDGISLKSRARRNLKREEGVTVRLWDGSESEFAAWYSSYSITGLRDHFTTRSASYIFSMLNIEDETVKPLLYVAYYKNELIGGIMTLRGKTEEVYLFGSSIKHSGNLSCGYSLQMHALAEAVKAGVKVYDLFGIPSSKGGGHLETLEVFKTSFGGEKVYRPESTDYIYNSLIATAYRAAETFRYYIRRNSYN